MDSFGLPLNPQVTRSIFNGTAVADGVDWQTWVKPRGKSQVAILCIGAGGGGGNGVVGAVSTAAGGGGGGSGAQTIVQVPADLLPDVLFVQVGQAKTGAGIVSRVALAPSTVATNQVTIARAGAVGGNASGATAGTAGAAGAITAVADCPLYWPFHFATAGQAGTAGGTTGAGPAVTIPATGIRVTGGAGGAGLGATAVAGTVGGAITGSGLFRTLPGGTAGTAATTPPRDGQNGPTQTATNNTSWFGGSGGGSTHGSASGAGLRQSNGGDGGIGSGGGGNGGAFTGSASAASRISKGGPGLVIIWAY